jgi:hypothetical protein
MGEFFSGLIAWRDLLYKWGIISAIIVSPNDEFPILATLHSLQTLIHTNTFVVLYVKSATRKISTKVKIAKDFLIPPCVRRVLKRKTCKNALQI